MKSAINHSINPGDVADQLVWDGVAGSKVGGAGIAHPDAIITLLPDKDLEW